MKLWDAFIAEHEHQLPDWSLRRTLELAWHYYQDGECSAVEKELEGEELEKASCSSSSILELPGGGIS